MDDVDSKGRDRSHLPLIALLLDPPLAVFRSYYLPCYHLQFEQPQG